MTTALVSLGSNLDDRAAALRQSLELLARHEAVRVTATSSFHETSPAGGPAPQEKFLNAAALLETTLPPRELLSILQRVENDLGRVRDQRWGPRTIDLDLLLYDQIELDLPELTLPHPRMSFRRFVLEPAAEIAADMIHPVCGNTIGGLLRHLEQTPRYVAIAGLDFDARNELNSVFPTDDPLRKFVTGRSSHHDPASQTAELLKSLDSLEQHAWLISNFWTEESHCNCAADLRLPYFAIQSRQSHCPVVQPRLLIVLDMNLNRLAGVEPSLAFMVNLYNQELRRIVHDEYHGPFLWMKDVSSQLVGSEVLAAIAAME